MNPTSKPLRLSIVVPIYNVAPYLADCLESVLAQTYPNLEIILINDGSTDDSLEIAKCFTQQDRRFQLVNQSNQGLSSARNAGVKLATGHYILFLDSDDMLLENAAEIIANNCYRFNLDLFMYSAQSFEDPDKDHLKMDTYYQRHPSLTNKILSGQALLTLAFRLQSISKFYNEETLQPSACLLALRSSIAKDLQFKDKIYHEDNLYLVQLLTHPKLNSLLVRNDLLYIRRKRKGSITAHYSEKHAYDCLTMFDLMTASKSNVRSYINKTAIEWLAIRALKTASTNFYHIHANRLDFSIRRTLFIKLTKLPRFMLHPRGPLFLTSIVFPEIVAGCKHALKKFRQRDS